MDTISIFYIQFLCLRGLHKAWTVCTWELKDDKPLACFYVWVICIQLPQNKATLVISYPRLDCSASRAHSDSSLSLSCTLQFFSFKISATFVLLWHNFFFSTFPHRVDCSGVAFKGQSDAVHGSAVISVAAVSTETRLQWAESRNKMTSPSPTHSESSSSSKHDSNQVCVCGILAVQYMCFCSTFEPLLALLFFSSQLMSWPQICRI